MHEMLPFLFAMGAVGRPKYAMLSMFIQKWSISCLFSVWMVDFRMPVMATKVPSVGRGLFSPFTPHRGWSGTEIWAGNFPVA